MAEYSGKTIIVTGGAKGIGAGITRAFAREGAKVACADVDNEAGEAIAAEGMHLAGEIRFFNADVAKSDPCLNICQMVIREWGGVDVLCNNVGIQPVDSYLPIHECSEEIWDQILGVNLKSVFFMTKYCLPSMMERGHGVIINTASVQGLQSAPMIPAYAASKGAMLSLTRQLSLDYASHGIRVLAVNPGVIDTPLVDEAIEAGGQGRDEFKARVVQTQPIGRYGQSEDIANAVLFLASEKASFITGEYLCVDGGLMAKGAWADL
jgi:dihydroanticapsin dehydrogenase